MSLAVYIPIIVAVATACFGAGLYLFQKTVDRRNALIDLRRKTYQDFIDAIFDNTLLQTEESLSEFNKFQMRLVIVASDDVAAKVGKWKEYMAQTSPGKNQYRDMRLCKTLMAEFIISMRKDCFEKSKLEIDRVYAMIPVED